MAGDRQGFGDKRVKSFEFRCDQCGEVHTGSPSFAYARPHQYFLVPKSEREHRIRIDRDTCVIDEDTFFVRGLLEIPIRDTQDPFLWGVWVSQSPESFARYVETFDQDQSGDGSFGWLTVTMPGYVRTPNGEELENLACDIRWQDVGQRPLIAPHECDHPLYRDFTNGIDWDRAIELAQLVLHSD
ncbi:MAG: DUF2199 domain-containing protein [Alphaproteobacteria bacterium]|nr:DUF2199 domain-containing protein [Alphaproteobacteria bacterium]